MGSTLVALHHDRPACTLCRGAHHAEPTAAWEHHHVRVVGSVVRVSVGTRRTTLRELRRRSRRTLPSDQPLSDATTTTLTTVVAARDAWERASKSGSGSCTAVGSCDCTTTSPLSGSGHSYAFKCSVCMRHTEQRTQWRTRRALCRPLAAREVETRIHAERWHRSDTLLRIDSFTHIYTQREKDEFQPITVV